MTQARDIQAPVPDWRAPPLPERRDIAGRHVQLEPLGPGHAAELFASFQGADPMWDYMPYGPFASEAAYADWIAANAPGDDPLFFALRDLASGRAAGVASYLRITPAAGTIELGHIALSPSLQQTRAATEAWFLMMEWAFAAGYRRFEWKCNAANLPSRRAAERLGLSYEGVFRQATVTKGHNRDTAWFAAIDGEWPALRAAFQRWLDPSNFDADGRQRIGLSPLTRPILVTADPALSG
jgi:RimJ/RimL family protein N-acetyltransferase